AAVSVSIRIAQRTHQAVYVLPSGRLPVGRRDISERLFALNSLEVPRDARSRGFVLLQLCVVPVYPPPGGVSRMRVTGRVCKGASSAFACGVLAFATLGVGLESTSAQGVPAPCYLQLLTSADQNSSSLSSSYFIEQVFLGGRIATNARAYRGYHCQPS